MPHFKVLVVTENNDDQEVCAALQPYKDAKWDWWLEGGRWDNSLLCNGGGRFNRLQKKDYDFDGDVDSAIKAECELHYLAVMYSDSTGSVDEYLSLSLDEKEEHIKKKAMNRVAPFAVVMNGEWHERGNMGCFGLVSNEDNDWHKKYVELLESIPDDHWLTIVNCHI